MQYKRIAFNFLLLSSPLQLFLCHHLKLNVVLYLIKCFLKKLVDLKQNSQIHPVKQNTGKKTQKKYPAQKHRASQIVKKKLTTPAKRLLRQYQLSHQRCSRGKGRSKVWQSPGTQDRSPSSLPFLRISYNRCFRH